MTLREPTFARRAGTLTSGDIVCLVLSTTSAGCWSIVLLVVGVPLILGGLAFTGMILLSGEWTLGHMYPILTISVPMLIIGVLALLLRRSVQDYFVAKINDGKTPSVTDD